MSGKITSAKLDDLLSLFEDTLQPDDIMCAKVTTQASRYITKERLRLNMNQKEFANHLHTTQSLVSRWESGKYNFSLKKLSEISVLLDMDLHIYMTPRCDNINVSSTYIYSTWNRVESVKETKVSKASICFFTSSDHQTFNTFSKPKEVISC